MKPIHDGIPYCAYNSRAKTARPASVGQETYCLKEDTIVISDRQYNEIHFHLSSEQEYPLYMNFKNND